MYNLVKKLPKTNTKGESQQVEYIGNNEVDRLALSSKNYSESMKLWE